jgi:hypothetical protein
MGREGGGDIPLDVMIGSPEKSKKPEKKIESPESKQRKRLDEFFRYANSVKKRYFIGPRREDDEMRIIFETILDKRSAIEQWAFDYSEEVKKNRYRQTEEYDWERLMQMLGIEDRSAGMGDFLKTEKRLLAEAIDRMAWGKKMNRDSEEVVS